ncbi:MAG: hypothetical protein ISR09_03230 [Candidatus Thalassarchaeum sp.]|nr:hypothetical protein [Candidatus Thalassarchaeum sp.]
MAGAGVDFFSEMFGVVFDFLDKKKWWRQWLKPLLYYGSLILPFAYLIGWYQGYF